VRKTTLLVSALALMSAAACKKTGEGEYQVQYPELDVKKDTATIKTPTVDVVKDTATVVVPKVQVKKDTQAVTIPKVRVKKP
jgi:hypothetical protein